MATYKRVKLFVNESFVSEDMVIYDEIWTSRLSKTDTDYRVLKYRIRYYRSTNPTAFGFEPGPQAEEISGLLEEYGPAISCYLEVWTSGKWSRCLDWFGDTAATAEEACMDLNDQYRSFVTGVPLEQDLFIPEDPTSPGRSKPVKPGQAVPGKDSVVSPPGTKSGSKKIDDLVEKYIKKPVGKDKEPSADDDDLDWI